MRVDQAVVFLPQEAADTRAAGEHLRGDDHQPCDAEAQAKAGEHVGQRGGYENFEQCLGGR